MSEILLFGRMPHPEVLAGNTQLTLGFGLVPYENPTDGHEAGVNAARFAVCDALPFSVPTSAVTIDKHPTGEPYAQLSSQHLEEQAARGIMETPVSITHDRGIAAAVAATDREDFETLRLGIDITFADPSKLTFKNPTRKLLVPSEYEETGDDVPKIATRWAIKEAVSKALGTGIRGGGVFLRQIETHENGDRFVVNLTEKAREIQDFWGITTWNIAVGRQDSVSIAVVVGHS